MADAYRPPADQLTYLEFLRHYRPAEYLRQSARIAVQRAVKRGELVKPDACSECGTVVPRRKLHAHHPDYERQLDVVWLCVPCHYRRHHPAVEQPPKDLTEREMDVWPLVAEGLTDKQIGARLDIATNTVRVYIVSLAYKLNIPGGVQTRVAIARRWWERQAEPNEAA